MSYEFWGDRILSVPEDENPGDPLGLTFGQYHIVSASVRGRMHIRNEIPREDAVSVYHKGDWLAVAVSDGVGSSRYSRLGASCAVNRVCQNLFDEIEKQTVIKKRIIPWPNREVEPGQEELEKVMAEAFRNTADNLKQHADNLAKTLKLKDDLNNSDIVLPEEASSTVEMGATPDKGEHINEDVASPREKLEPSFENDTISLSDLHCTLLAFILNLKSGTMAFAQIGDGLMLGLTEDLAAMPLIDPQVPGQTGQTYVITQKDWERYFSVKVMPGEKSKDYLTIYLMTDGVADDCQYGPPEDILQRWANDMNSEIRKYDVETTKERLRNYLNHYEAKGSYDDRTLVAIYRSTNQR